MKVVLSQGRKRCAAFLLALGAGGATWAQAAPVAPRVDTGDTAWVLASAGLVLLMTPGLAFFYGGLVRRKNVLSILMQCFMAMCLVTVLWVVAGYSLAFGPDIKGLIGNLDWAFLRGVGGEPHADYAATIPHTAFMAFQLKFAIITPALIIGAFAERLRFSAFCLFVLTWSLLVYTPVAHWVWGVGGFLRTMGALDFAGGTVVHVNAGMAALAAALVLGKRRGNLSPPHSLPLAILGAGMLWFGWFGFNAGSALGANALAANAFVTTHVATAVAGLGWSLMDWVFFRKPTTLGMITGAVAGLVSITPACGFVTPIGAMWNRPGCGGDLLAQRHRREDEGGLRRHAGCLRRPRRGRHLGRPGHGALCHEGGESGRCQWAVLWQSRAVHCTTQRDADHDGVLLRCQHPPAQNHRPDRRPARHRAGGAYRPRSHPAPGIRLHHD
jgi:Amt family ammonium transporter